MTQHLRILLTGASGFLGSCLQSYLRDQGHLVHGLGRHASNEIVADLTTQVPALQGHYDLVIHAAGKAHMVPANDAEARAFYDVNLEGTKHLCEGLSLSGTVPDAFVFISTVAVYGVEEGSEIDESWPLEGQTPYAKSKIAAEQWLQDWCAAKGTRLTILRLPLVVGLHAPGNLRDMELAIQKGRYFNIGSGDARKSMVLASDVAAYTIAASKVGGIFNLTDGHHPSFAEISAAMAAMLGKPKPHSIQMWMARMAALAGDLFGPRFPLDTKRLKKITSSLIFADLKARKAFGWNPQPALTAYKPN